MKPKLLMLARLAAKVSSLSNSRPDTSGKRDAAAEE